MQYDIFGDVANLAARMEQTSPYGAVHMPKASYDKMMSEMTEDQKGLFDGIVFDTHENVEIKNMGKIDTVSLSLTENDEDRIESVLIGCLSDDKQRAVTTHIGVLAESFRRQSWSGVRLSMDDDAKKKNEDAGNLGDGEENDDDDDDDDGENYMTLIPD